MRNSIIIVVLSTLCACGALLYQKYDHVKGYGSTTGGQMATAAIWLLVAILAGIGFGMILKNFWIGVAAFVVIYIASYVIRRVFESLMIKKHSGKDKKSTAQNN